MKCLNFYFVYNSCICVKSHNKYNAREISKIDQSGGSILVIKPKAGKW